MYVEFNSVDFNLSIEAINAALAHLNIPMEPLNVPVPVSAPEIPVEVDTIDVLYPTPDLGTFGAYGGILDFDVYSNLAFDPQITLPTAPQGPVISPFDFDEIQFLDPNTSGGGTLNIELPAPQPESPVILNGGGFDTYVEFQNILATDPLVDAALDFDNPIYGGDRSVYDQMSGAYAATQFITSNNNGFYDGFSSGLSIGDTLDFGHQYRFVSDENAWVMDFL